MIVMFGLRSNRFLILRKSVVTLAGASFALVFLFFSMASADAIREERRQLVELIGSKVFSEPSSFVAVPNGRGWRTFAISPFGSSTESLVEAYTEVDQRFAYSAAREATVDSVVSINDGVVVFAEESLPSMWKAVLDYSRPRGAIRADRLLSSPTLRWLFRPTGRFSKTGDRIYSREPSRFLIRYNQYKADYIRLLELRGNDAWQYVSPFSQHSSFQQALDAHLHAWETSGYKREIESAQLEFGFNAQPFVYRRWSEANEKFDYFSESFGGGISSYETLILPSPASWPGLFDWKNVRYKSDTLECEFRFQLFVVDVSRPWLDVDFLFELNDIDVDEASVSLNEGIEPVFGSRLSGRFTGLIDQIVLVRGIDWINPANLQPCDNKPVHSVLGRVAYPQAINVLGYIVHIMPKIDLPVNVPGSEHSNSLQNAPNVKSPDTATP